jgi:hypothetical protein
MLWLAFSVALAAKPPMLTVTVVDEAGQPVTTAWVQFADEGEQTHTVHGETGTWTGNGLDLPSGERAPFKKGQSVSFSTGADGYEKEDAVATLGKKGTELTVTLEHSEPEPVDETPVDEGPEESFDAPPPLPEPTTP